MPNTATSDYAAWQEMQAKLMATGWCQAVTIGEPKAPPQRITAAILGESGDIDENTLSSPREVHRAILRFYANWSDEAADEGIERDLEQIRANIWADICGDFELGGDIAYIMPSLCSWRFGNLQVGQTMYRVLDMTVAYRIDDRATFVA